MLVWVRGKTSRTMAHGEQSVVFSKQRGCLKGLNIATMSMCSAPIARTNNSFNEAKLCLVTVVRKTPDNYDYDAAVAAYDDDDC